MTVMLRKIDDADCYQLVEWRNQNRDYFLDSAEITLAEHLRWYEGYLYRPKDQMYIVEVSSRSVGTIGVQLVGTKDFEIQRVMLGDKGLARAGVMSEALAGIFEAYGQGWYSLEVLRVNLDAQRFYAKNGFRVISQDDQGSPVRRMGRHV